MIQGLRRIVVGYDASPEAESALTWAVESARTDAGRVEVVVVASAMDPVLSEYREVSEARAEQWRQHAEATLSTMGATPASVRILHGPTYPQLLAVVEPEDLLVVGSIGHPLILGMLSSSVSQHLIRRARCPVVVVRPRQDRAARRIVVGVDESPASNAALAWACARATTTGEEVLALTACPAAPAGRARPKTPSERQQARLDLATLGLRRKLGPLRCAFPKVPIDSRVVSGSPGPVLVEETTHASLIVVGSRGRDPVVDLLAGSTAQHVLRRAHCPVVVVRAQTAATAVTETPPV